MEAALQAEAASLAEAAQPVEAAQPAEAASLAEAAQTAEAASLVEAAQPAEAASLVEAASPAEAASPVQAVQHVLVAACAALAALAPSAYRTAGRLAPAAEGAAMPQASLWPAVQTASASCRHQTTPAAHRLATPWTPNQEHQAAQAFC